MSASSSSSLCVRVGVGVIVRDPNDASRVLCGVRKNSHGAGKLALPGGHLEMYESWDGCACREVKEECDLDLESSTLSLAHVTNDPMPDENKHYVTIFMMGSCKVTEPIQEPKTMEPHKCEGWDSYSWDELKLIQSEGKLFGPLDRLVRESPGKVLHFLGIDEPNE